MSVATGCPAPGLFEARLKYWGCWTEATGKKNVYDIELDGDALGLHSFTFLVHCGDSAKVASTTEGYFIGDTLIIDSGVHLFRCHILGDTLFYSAYLGGFEAVTERLIKLDP